MKKSKRLSAQEGAELVAEFEASGLTQREYGTRNDVAVATLQYWLRKSRNDGQSKGKPDHFRFVEVVGQGEPNEPMAGMSMELADGLTLRFESLPDPSYLASVADAFDRE
jgi:hypothetical protein